MTPEKDYPSNENVSKDVIITYFTSEGCMRKFEAMPFTPAEKEMIYIDSKGQKQKMISKLVSESKY